jgi:hypothetical protein
MANIIEKMGLYDFCLKYYQKGFDVMSPEEKAVMRIEYHKLALKADLEAIREEEKQ